MFKLENLLCNDFFPNELPPCFSTYSIKDILSLPEIVQICDTEFNEKATSPLFFSGYKTESSRRKFAIPNFVMYMKLAKIIVDNSNKIFELLSKSNSASLTAPISKEPKDNEAFSKKCKNFPESKLEIEKLYYCNQFELRLDITSFFDNIYTHSIAWAVETKNIAKKKSQDLTLLGNQLDILTRSMNNNQTNGILVGNALSRIISEIILCDVDKKIQADLKNIKYKRYVDDYYIYTENGYEIPNIISVIRKHLNDYELFLNENKIQINESPFIYGKPWIENIRQYIHLDPFTFFNKLIVNYKKYKDVSLLRYGLKIISLYSYSKEQWLSFEPKILNLLVTFPSLADIIINILLINKDYINKHNIKNAIYTIINSSVQLSYDQELIWMAWYIKVFQINISIEYSIKILEYDNVLANIILLDYLKTTKNQIYKHNTILNWRREVASKMKAFQTQGQNVMESKYWLLAYEGTRNKWFNFSDSTFNELNSNQSFVSLLRNDVFFYDNKYEYSMDNPKHNPYYISRDEVIEKFNELKQCISEILGKDNPNAEKLAKIKFDSFEKAISIIDY